MWLKQIKGALGYKDEEKKILLNIITQAAKKRAPSEKSTRSTYPDDAYVLLTSLLNYLPLITMRDVMELPKVLKTALTKLDVAICGPIWNPILHAATNQIISLNEYTETRNFFNELMPLVLLRRHQVFN